MGDALGVDWSSIVEESKRKVKEESQLGVNTAKQKLKPHRVLLDIGISEKMAGKEFAKQVIMDSYACMEEEIREEVHTKTMQEISVKNESRNEIKGEPSDEASNDDKNMEEKPCLNIEEKIEQKLNEKLPFTTKGLIDRPYAFSQLAYKERLQARKKLIINASGAYTRALSARQDLKIRRKLCGLPEEETIVEKTPAPPLTTDENAANVSDAPPVCAPKQSSMEIIFSMFKKTIGEAC